MTPMASPDRYPRRTCSMTVWRLGAVSAASAGQNNTRTSHRNMSEDLEARSLGLACEQIFHTNLPSAGRVVNGYGDESGGATLRSQQISGVVADGLPGWIHHIDMHNMIRRRGGCGKTHAQSRRIAALPADARCQVQLG